jgi:hypothetical protein
MLDTAKLQGQDGKTLPWRHPGGISAESEERTRKGDPPDRPYRKKPFLLVARGCFYIITRINSEKWEKRAGIRGK